MAEVSSAEVSKNFGTYREIAEGSRGAPEPVNQIATTEMDPRFAYLDDDAD